MSAAEKTASGLRCANCGRATLEQRVITDRFEYTAYDQTLLVEAEGVPVKVCTNCGEEFSGPEAARIRHNAICRALHLLTPEEIKTIRDRLGMTQGEFAALTGIGEATLSRWERARQLQNRALDRYLRLLSENADNVKLLQEIASETATRADPSERETPSWTPPAAAEATVIRDSDPLQSSMGKIKWFYQLVPADEASLARASHHKTDLRDWLSASLELCFKEPSLLNPLTESVKSLARSSDNPEKSFIVQFFFKKDESHKRLVREFNNLAQELTEIPEPDQRRDLLKAYKQLTRVCSRKSS
jgi:putative zinc finger/helix-turn-helix YgiT family protein